MDNKRESFSDRLTPHQVQQVFDAIEIPWRDYDYEENEGWINIQSVSLNVLHGGWINWGQYGVKQHYNFEGLRKDHDYLDSGDLVRWVMISTQAYNANTEKEAIKWIRNVLNVNNNNNSKTHNFLVNDASKYGIPAAVILSNIRFWLDTNKAKEDNIVEGRVWMYMTHEGFRKFHPYLKAHQIRYQLDQLEKAGILITDNFNKKSYDRTKWYSVNEQEYQVNSGHLRRAL